MSEKGILLTYLLSQTRLENIQLGYVLMSGDLLS
jgi:hypothetical protein